MKGRFQHSGHVFRVAAIFAMGIAGFLVLRWMLVPRDFGLYGFYRAGALTDIRAKPPAHAGRAACEECHSGVYDPPDDFTPAAGVVVKTAALTWPVEKDVDNKHALLNCEACHGPLAKHADDPEKTAPKVGNDKLCLTCHRELPGRPNAQPQVEPGDHSDRANARQRVSPRERRGDQAVPASERVGGSAGAKPPGSMNDPCVSCHKPHRPKTDE